MKKGTRIMFFCVLYVGLLSGLLTVQIQKIAGSAERFMAMAELLLLLLFVVAILALYINGQRKEEKGEEMQIGKKGDYEENYEQFLQ